MNARKITVDVREDIRNGHEPFSKIMVAATQLQLGEQLLLIAPFEPRPLYAVLGKQGFTPSARTLGSGDWEVLFTRHQNALVESLTENQTTIASRNGTESPAEEILEVDARGLEPPQPMVKILETLAAMPMNAMLRARTDRRPIHLYPQLEQRGFTAQTEEQTDGSYLTCIRRG
jgi:uncharacterized protein (DUF2249 family)